MRRSFLKNLANKTKNINDIESYKKQRNFVVKLNMKEKKRFFKSIESSENRFSLLMQYLQPVLIQQRCIIRKIITDGIKIADIFNPYFCNITKYLNISLRENNKSAP